MKKLAFAFCLTLSGLAKDVAQAQAQSGKLHIPDIPGYRTLKCDFHMHTVFSDGHVWPTFRVHEAVRDGLDVIAITEHIDYEGFPDEIRKDYNKSYQLAQEAARGKDLLVISGVEISPRVPPYHHNALFVSDANALPADYMKSGKKEFVMKEDMTRTELMAPFLAAQKQEAFVFYNHPGWGWWDGKDTTLFTPFHQELLDRGILKGVEVANSGNYNVIAHRLAMEHGLTMISNSDEHYDVFPRYRDGHRPMTLVFAEEKTAEGVRKALLERRTAAFFDNYLVARQQEAEALFKASVHASLEKQQRKKEPRLLVKLYNESDIPFRVSVKSEYDLEGHPLGQVTLNPRDTAELVLRAVWVTPRETLLEIEVTNILVSPEEALKTRFVLRSED